MSCTANGSQYQTAIRTRMELLFAELQRNPSFRKMLSHRTSPDDIPPHIFEFVCALQDEKTACICLKRVDPTLSACAAISKPLDHTSRYSSRLFQHRRGFLASFFNILPVATVADSSPHNVFVLAASSQNSSPTCPNVFFDSSTE